MRIIKRLIILILVVGSLQIYTANAPFYWQIFVRIVPTLFSLMVIIFAKKLVFRKSALWVLYLCVYIIVRNSIYAENTIDWFLMNSKVLSVLNGIALSLLVSSLNNHERFALYYTIIHLLVSILLLDFIPDDFVIFDNVKGHRLKFDPVVFILISSRFLATGWFSLLFGMIVYHILILKQWLFSIFLITVSFITLRLNLLIKVLVVPGIMLVSTWYLISSGFISLNASNTLGIRYLAFNSVISYSYSAFELLFGLGVRHPSMEFSFQNLFGQHFYPNDLGILGVYFQLGLVGVMFYVRVLWILFKSFRKNNRLLYGWIAFTSLFSPWMLVFPGLIYFILSIDNRRDAKVKL